MVAGIGIDILDVARMERELAREGHGMRDEVFTDGEVARGARSGRPARHLAACFAAKEALFKALGTGWSQGLAWREVELAEVGPRGELVLSGRTREVAFRLGVRRAWASTSHCGELAIASVVLETGEQSHQME